MSERTNTSPMVRAELRQRLEAATVLGVELAVAEGIPRRKRSVSVR
jgi:hypothetical protein